ncbi:MAG: glycosyltransferase [Hyphomicrobiaceae bacterium]|nr:glycosyltransferase [Hyphomicrobiaceae bacterium]
MAGWQLGRGKGGRAPNTSNMRTSSRLATQPEDVHNRARVNIPVVLAPPQQGYDFLISVLSPTTLAVARAEAAVCHLPLHRVLHATGSITPERYSSALARACGVPTVAWDLELKLSATEARAQLESPSLNRPLAIIWRHRMAFVISATHAEPKDIANQADELRRAGHIVVLAPDVCIRASLEQRASAALLSDATRGLARTQPEVSAARRGPAWQPLFAAILIGVIIGGICIDPRLTLAAAATSLAVFFMGVVAIRCVALTELFRARPSTQIKHQTRVPDAELPVYTIMVALYDEECVLPSLISSLKKLDYPAAKLDILLVLEEVDIATQSAMLRQNLPAHMRVVIVPDGQPRTKPKALNYALTLARGDYVVVYDAEDRPETDQLRRALHAFVVHGSDLACAQACLNIYNARQGWLTTQFAFEYSALFDAVLPALDRLGIPVPLGGTSNHFPRRLLDDLGGWDPYNVTEDADLGIRIARLGYKTTMIASTTWEEAPSKLRAWRTQRTRWLKGWMQTVLVHTRDHRALRRELGFARTLGLHLYMTGLILSALVHPYFYLALGAETLFGVGIGAEPLLAPLVWGVATATLIMGYVASIATGWIAARKRGHTVGLRPMLMPLYWLLISAMSYRALWQLIWDPFKWEKTPHGSAVEDATDNKRRPKPKRTTR